MLACEDLTVSFGDKDAPVLKGVKAVFEPASLNAVIGPSGCGKTTLMKAMLGILPAESGRVFCGKNEVETADELVGRVGFAPQFTTAHEKLRVEEAIAYALDLFVTDASLKTSRLNSILEIIGLEPQRQQLVSSLSGGQLRRLGLGLELVSDPVCMICDEVTSGLDPRSEDQILELLQKLSRKRGKTFINIIHNLGKLSYFDSITVVFEGDVVFQGTLKELLFYFSLEDPMLLYDRLNEQPLEYWQEHWREYSAGMISKAEHTRLSPPPSLPSGFSQMLTLLQRRFLLFVRDRGYLLMTFAIMLGFPCVVTLFALGGLPDIAKLALDQGSMDMFNRMREEMQFQISAARTGSLVTGLILFQVILLTLMASNNGAREIASERRLFEKERLNGLRAGAYAVSKMLFVTVLAIAQGTVMTVFVKYVCEFPGALWLQWGVLCLCCISMSFVCLGFSALARSSERASLLSIYLVGFQLPLSGVVLALPEALVWVCRPFINAYWSWVGYISSMQDSPLYMAVQLSGQEQSFASTGITAMVLVIQALVGALMVFWGCQNKHWD